ncbi:GntR family transcriptional regulator [Oscillospiraceae bacterium LTW-04]|nr:GntR family transcriptional regulator [Oscillospiraceae bacterium MB24-C1]
MNLTMYPQKSSETMGDYIYRTLYKNIIHLNLIPGECLSPLEVAQAFGSSRTPVQGAFSRLLSDGLLDIFPQRGSYVSIINIKRVYESIFMRNLLEQAVVRVLCEKEVPESGIVELEANLSQQNFYYEKNMIQDVFDLDNKFHRTMFELAGLEHIQQALESIVADQYRVRVIKLHSRLRWEQTVDEHQKLIDAIRQKNVELGCRQSFEHIARFGVDIEAAYKLYPQYFSNWNPEFLQMFTCKMDAFYNMKFNIK